MGVRQQAAGTDRLAGLPGGPAWAEQHTAEPGRTLNGALKCNAATNRRPSPPTIAAQLAAVGGRAVTVRVLLGSHAAAPPATGACNRAAGVGDVRCCVLWQLPACVSRGARIFMSESTPGRLTLCWGGLPVDMQELPGGGDSTGEGEAVQLGSAPTVFEAQHSCWSAAWEATGESRGRVKGGLALEGGR